MRPFRASIALLGINPYVLVPPRHLEALFKAAARDKGPIPVRGTLDRAPFQQTLVKYQGAWRLYLNTPMRRAVNKDVGDIVAVSLEVDPKPRVEPVPSKFRRALAKDEVARAAYATLIPSRKKEILRYLNALKTELSLERNIATVIRHLRGERPPLLAGLMRSKRSSQG